MIKTLNGLKSASAAKKREQLINSLIRYEAKLGGELFGRLPKGRERQFFCLDERTWVWYESWHDANGQYHSRTTSYIVRPKSGIVKTTGDGNYSRLTEAEARNLYQTIEAYQQKVHTAYQKLLNPAI